VDFLKLIINKYGKKIFEWYYDTIYLTGEKFIDTNKEITYYHVDIKELNDYHAMNKLLAFFNITPLETINDIINKPLNKS